MTDQAPFIPSSPEENVLPPAPWRVFGTRPYYRLWRAQTLSSLGDWVGLFATLNIANQISGAATAVSLVIVARILPGFFLATLGGVIVDRFDRRRVMMYCDVGRAGLLVLLPFVTALWQLVAISFALEILTLLWGPAKDASMPHLVDTEQLASANSLSLVASYGTMPLGGVVYALLLTLAKWLGGFDALSRLEVDREMLALWVDSLTFVASALVVARLPIPHEGRHAGTRLDLGQTLRDVVEGLRFIRTHPLVRAVMTGLAGGLVGAGAMIPLGPVFADKVLGSPSQFSVLMAALGVGAGIGVLTLLGVQRRLPKETAFVLAVLGVGVFLVAAASTTIVLVATISVVVVGACSGAAYVAGFTVIQENVHDELRGRTFATLYAVVRLCLLLSLFLSPVFADLLEWLTGRVLDDRTLHLGGFSYPLPGVRLALWGGSTITLAGAWWARHQLRATHLREARAVESRRDDSASRADEASGRAQAGGHAEAGEGAT